LVVWLNTAQSMGSLFAIHPFHPWILIWLSQS
jgi:hypothetical protein